MCPNCSALEADPKYPHAALKWRMEEFDPIASDALGAKVYEECSLCKERWYLNRTRHRGPVKRGSRK